MGIPEVLPVDKSTMAESKAEVESHWTEKSESVDVSTSSTSTDAAAMAPMSASTAARLYWKAIGWTMFFSLGVIMLAFDQILLGNLYAMPTFQRDFGVLLGDEYIIPATWQSALSLGSPCGAVVGALTAGYPLDRFGRKRTFGFAVVLISLMVLIQFLSSSLRVLLAGELLAGLCLGYFVVIAPTYASEVCPLALRGYLGAYINFTFVLGQTLSNGVTLGTSTLESHWAYKTPFCLQWLWPLLMILGLFFAPESPWWLVRQDRIDSARASLMRLTTSEEQVEETLRSIITTTNVERVDAAGPATYASCLQSDSRRRTLLIAGVYCTQYVCGLLLLAWCTYFFELAGLPSRQAYYVTFTLFGVGMVGTACSWFLLSSRSKTVSSRRNIWLTGLACLITLLLALGIVDVVPGYDTAYAWAQAGILITWNFIYDLTVGPTAYVLLVELSSPRLRARTVAIATAVQGCVGIIFIVIVPHLIGPDAAALRGKVGFIFAGTGALCWVWAWVYVPETRGRTYDDINTLFARRLRARNFAREKIDSPSC